MAGLFLALFPDVMPSTLEPACSLTTANAAATPYTLKIMTCVAVIFTPVVLAYQGWTYWVFRKRIASTTSRHAACPPRSGEAARPAVAPAPGPAAVPGNVHE